jgi:hypothetical protein
MLNIVNKEKERENEKRNGGIATLSLSSKTV